MARPVALLLIACLLSPPAMAGSTEVVIPAGTPIYGETEEAVTSKKKDTGVGDIVRARVWRNVVVDGHTVIRAGAPMLLKVSHVRPAKIAGRKGQLELEAVSARAVDGRDVFLDGGYDKSGKGRKALSITLFAVVAWPLIFLKGKQAILPPGTVFDGVIQADTPCSVEVEDAAPAPRVALGGVVPRLEIEPLYEDMDEDGKDPSLPLIVKLCAAGELAAASVVTVNEAAIPPIAVTLDAAAAEDGCQVARGVVDLGQVGKHFAKGINRFEIEAGGLRSELILDVEL